MSKILQTSESYDVEDISLISHYPISYAKEALVLIRRLAFLKLMMQDVPPSQYESLDDSKDFEDLITNLINSKGKTVEEFVNIHHPYITRESNSYDDEDD